ncbi:MAG: DUF4911 domain-containing protein [Humidesulfovibrio sp.]|jgi:hypothetical protein|uniref:DUF4911 domain-containing protein n=1 Tax=Humidesulfovibrio sp. TaxID=2910988 RepID=UPI0027324B56|nr:DUF4911 domain-containing protein [Humidesulfovibrio sp.]MDP2849215.1 DUF4911 domain-containing protein [Humidesulfovibrio sp.]
MRSEMLYLRLPRPHVAFFRFLLEAHEGLAMFTSLGADANGREVLCLRYAPGAGGQVRQFLAAIRNELELTLLVDESAPQPPAAPQDMLGLGQPLGAKG